MATIDPQKEEQRLKEVSLKRKLLSTVVIIFAIVGFVDAIRWSYSLYRLPHVVAQPFSFLIVEIRNAKDPSKLRARIYLDDVTDIANVHFDGTRLKWERTKITYPRANVPFDGFVVTGNGSVLFGSARVDIDDERIMIGGREVQPINFTVARNGAFREGDIRIAQ